MLIYQRIKVIVRLLGVMVLLLRKKYIGVSDFFKVRRAGNGLCSTFIVGERAVIKIRNELSSLNNRRLYNGAFDGLFHYQDDDERITNEFRLCEYFHQSGLTPKPLLHTRTALVTSYVAAEKLHGLSSPVLAQIFDLMDRVHALGVFHGDFNLDNFLLCNDTLYIVDFESSRNPDKGQEEDLYCLDYIIFIEKLYRFHPDIFQASIENLRKEIEKRRKTFPRIIDMGRKFLPTEVADAIFI